MGLGRSDGRKTYSTPILPDLNRMPFTPVQKAILDAKGFAVKTAPPFIHPALSLFNPPADADYFRITPSQFIAYPAVGASPIPVISFTVPRGRAAFVTKLAIVHVGGNPPDGSGIVIWRVVKNGGGLRGLGNLTAQCGTFAAPLTNLTIVCVENDTLQVTVECPPTIPNGWPPLGIIPGGANPGPPAGSSTAASFDGFMYSLNEATVPRQGSF